jgi:hypothetical protein
VADTPYVASTGALSRATAVQADLANATMHLFLSTFTPTPTTPLSEFQANECNFDGYTPAAIATWSNPVLAGTAWAIYAPTQTFRWVFATGITNMVGGYWLQDAGGTLIDYVVFNPAEAAAGTGQAIIRTPIEVFPWG